MGEGAVMALRTIPFHRSLTRDNLFMGGDRELVMFVGLCSFALVFTALSFIAFVYGLFLWLICLYFLRKMAKSDPKMRDVYIRHIKYAAWYPAKSSPLRENKKDYQ